MKRNMERSRAEDQERRRSGLTRRWGVMELVDGELGRSFVGDGGIELRQWYKIPEW